MVNDSFVHNSRSELASTQVNGETYGYDYDNVGNRRMSMEAGDYAFYEANALNQYTDITGSEDEVDFSFTPIFDADGNQTLIKTETGIWAAVYNAENRPVSFTNEATGTVVTCAYDSMGRRSFKQVTTNGTVTLHQRYLYRGYLQIACIDLTRSHHPGLWLITWDPTQSVATRPLASQKDGTWYTYGLDLTKNVCEVFGSTGYIATSYTYSPYGSVTASGSVTQPIQWSSEFNDVENCLFFYNYRHYNAMNGLWLSRDASEEVTGVNLYGFTRNNPIMLFDILGLLDDKCCKDGKLYKEITDDAGRRCCEYELKDIAIQVEPHGNYLQGEVGHAWIQTPNIQLGFYPDSWHRGILGAGDGIVQDENSLQFSEERKHRPDPRNSYTYKACPESIKSLEKNMSLSKQNPPEYSLYNDGDARNCCGWACEIVEKSGFRAPFAPNTVTLAPGAPGQKCYGPGRQPIK